MSTEKNYIARLIKEIPKIQNKYVKKKAPKNIRAKEFISYVLLFSITLLL
jgi:hypothetical protein